MNYLKIYFMPVMAFVLMLDSMIFGQITFVRNYGGSGTDRAFCIQQTSDEGYILTGLINGHTNPLSGEFMLMKLDKNGDSLWTRAYGLNKHQIGDFVLQCNDGGFFAIGYTTADSAQSQNTYVIKTTSDGTLQWEKTIGVSPWGYAGGRAVLANDGSILAAYTLIEGGPSLIKLDNNGNAKWIKNYTVLNNSIVNQIVESDDKGYILAGTRAFLFKTDSLGNMLWYKNLGLIDTSFPDGGVNITSITRTNGGGVLLAGYKTVKEMSYIKSNMYIIRTDSKGDTLWTRTYNDKEGGIVSFDITPDGGFILCGSRGEDKGLLKIDSSGNILWEKSLANYNIDLAAVKSTADGGFIAAGMQKKGAELFADVSVSVLKTDDKGNVSEVEQNNRLHIPNGFILYQNYPNPFNPSTKISFLLEKEGYVELSLHNVLGKKLTILLDKFMHEGLHEFDFDINTSMANLASGIYIYVLKTQSGFVARKMALIK